MSTSKQITIVDQKLVNKTITDVFDIFRTTNLNIDYGNITQREAVKELIKRYGVEQTVYAAQYAVIVQEEPYAPVITEPLILLKKFTNLWIYFKRQQKQEESNFIVG